MHTRISPVLRLASVGLFALPHSVFALPLAALPGASLEINQPDIQPVCDGGRHWVEDKVASLEPFIEKSLEDDEPDGEQGKSKFERPVKGYMPLPPKRPPLPAGNTGYFMMTACKPLSPAELAQKRKEEAKKQREADRKWAKTPPDLKRYYKRMERVIALRMKHYHEQRDKEWAEGDMRHARSDEMLHHVLDVVLDDNTPDSVQASPH